MAQLPQIWRRNPKVYKERRAPNDAYYRTQFRFNDASVIWIANQFLGPDSGETRGGALTNKQKMEITLRYMADPVPNFNKQMPNLKNIYAKYKKTNAKSPNILILVRKVFERGLIKSCTLKY